jgi:hypothetical protein
MNEYCVYCGSIVFDEDRNCKSCGAPRTKHNIEINIDMNDDYLKFPRDYFNNLVEGKTFTIQYDELGFI